jgi:hypothetical protein
MDKCKPIIAWAARMTENPKSAEAPPRGWHSKDVKVAHPKSMHETVFVSAKSVTGEVFEVGPLLTPSAEILSRRYKPQKGETIPPVSGFFATRQKKPFASNKRI